MERERKHAVRVQRRRSPVWKFDRVGTPGLELAGMWVAALCCMKNPLLKVSIFFFVLTPLAFGSGPAEELPPAKCEADYPSFSAWLTDVRKEALQLGISKELWDRASQQMRYDETVVQKDRQQGGFYKSFLEFSLPRAHGRIARARQVLRANKEIFDRAEKEFGVPGQVITAFWGMETDFATKQVQNSSPILASMATLAFDCRRAAYFRQNLFDALRLVQEGDVALEDLRGQWAGEMGGLQFTPSNFYKYGIDFDNDGRRDVVNSVADMIGTAASMFRDYGWFSGEPFLLEVKVPESMAWEEADLTVTNVKTLRFWGQQGVRQVDGSSLPDLNLKAALMLPMGRFGPAFLAYENFRTLLQWNASLNNALTAAYLANRIADAGSKAMNPGAKDVEVLSHAKMLELQRNLTNLGYDVGGIDGFLGTKTRAAVRDVQLKRGLPADSYPTSELLNLLK